MDDRKWINSHPKTMVVLVLLTLLVSLAVSIRAYLPDIRRQFQYRKRQRARLNRLTREKQDTRPVVKGKLIFEKIPLNVKELSGKLRPLRKPGRTVKCGDSLDVMWTDRSVLFMKEKGLLEQMLVTEDPRFSDLEWDGRYIWLGVPEKGIWVLDTSGTIVVQITPERGLPPAEKGLLLHPIEPGKIFAVGSFGPFGRGWCAVVEFNNGQPSVNVFHEAKRVPLEIEDREEIKRDPYVAFRPYWIGEYLAYARPLDPNSVVFEPPHVRLYRLGGRRTLFIRRCAKKYRDHNLIHLLQVDLDTLSVSIGPRKGIPSRTTGPPLEYEGMVYMPGRVWYRIDPNRLRRERLVTQGQLPYPYGSLRGYWVSAHYGLAGWTRNREFCRITITREEHDIMAESPATQEEYFHTFTFASENGSSSKVRALESLQLTIHRKDSPPLNYTCNASWPRGYFPLGTYKASGTKTNRFGRQVKICEFQPIVVAKDSPVRLVLKITPEKHRAVTDSAEVKYVRAERASQEVRSVAQSSTAMNTRSEKLSQGDDDIVYTGQVVDAVTGKPIGGAFAITGFASNLAWITPEEWTELHKLPTNPSLADEALWSLKNTTPLKLKRVVRADANGRFVIGFRRTNPAPELVIFEKDYLKAIRGVKNSRARKDGRVELSPTRLFPAGKVFIEPSVPVLNLRLRFTAQGSDNSNTAAVFMEMCRGRYSAPRLEKRLRQPCYVPAGVTLRAWFSMPHDNGWCIPDIPQTINLKQGETLDLGRFVFDPEIRILIKVIDAAGKPVVGVRLARLFDDPYKMIGIHRTDEHGICPYNVEPNSEVRFNVFRHEDQRILKSITFEIGGRENNGKEFEVQL